MPPSSTTPVPDPLERADTRCRRSTAPAATARVDQPGVEDLARDHPDRPGQAAGDAAGPRGTAPAGAAASSRRPRRRRPPRAARRGRAGRCRRRSTCPGGSRPGRAAARAGPGRACRAPSAAAAPAGPAPTTTRSQVPRLSSRAGIIGDRYPSRGPLTPAGRRGGPRSRGMGFSRVALQVSCQRSGPGAERTWTSQAAPATSKTTVVTSPPGSRETRRETSRSAPSRVSPSSRRSAISAACTGMA